MYYFFFLTLISGNPCTCLTVQPALDDQYLDTKPSFSSINQTRFSSYQQESQVSYSEFGDNRDEARSQEETSIVISDLFQGFLTIGTLGAETVINEPETPTFAIPLEGITERNAEVTENDLKLISYELEKFLEAENKERLYESFGRNSYVSTITHLKILFLHLENQKISHIIFVCSFAHLTPKVTNKFIPLT